MHGVSQLPVVVGTRHCRPIGPVADCQQRITSYFGAIVPCKLTRVNSWRFHAFLVDFLVDFFSNRFFDFFVDFLVDISPAKLGTITLMDGFSDLKRKSMMRSGKRFAGCLANFA